jgi:diadenosine tetraphosphate (Ap4A) HIT family hydrolase/SAM-dependent methyltransferase
METMNRNDLNCELCREVAYAGTDATARRSGDDVAGIFSRLIIRTSIVDVLAGLGSLIPGYVLIVPRRHVSSAGELRANELIHTYGIAWTMARRIKAAFGGTVVLVEHGSSGNSNARGRACIDHAHIHLFPLDSGSNPARFVAPDSFITHNLHQLRDISMARKNYYYCAWNQHEGRLSVAPVLESQYPRRIWAELVGRPDEWDWAACPYFENARFTSVRLRFDELSSEEVGLHLGAAELRETLDAYECSAEWYATQTKTFPPGSTLPEEIAALAGNTRGVILDAGAGAGRDAELFAHSGRPVIALDASPRLLAYVAAAVNLLPVVGDVRCLPMSSESIGAVWCSAVLLHLGRDDVLRTLREFRRVLIPGGLAQVSVKEGSGHSSSAMPGSRVSRRHFFFYELDDLILLAKLAGLEVARTWMEDESNGSATVQRWVKALLRRP